MLIPFDMIAVMLFLGYYTMTPASSPPPILHSAGLVLLGGVLLFAGAAALNFVALRRLRRPDRRDIASRRGMAGTADVAVRCGLTAAYVAVIVGSAFPWSAMAALGWKPFPEALAAQLFGLAPYLLYFFAAWLPMYGLHRETSYGVWTRLSFIVHKARYNLFMLLAWIPFAVLADWLSEFLVALPFVFLLAAWAFPYLLAKTWGCKTLPEGEALETVRRLEKKAGAGFSRVYLWEPGGGGMQNAAAVGIFRPFRYLFLTPALVANMKPDELEAVILHELGHVKKKHLLFYLFTSLAGINLAVLAGSLLPMAGMAEQFIITVALVLLYFRLLFGWLSRNMERQADLFSLEKSGSARPIANALEKLALSAGNIRLAHSWHHLGIAERVRYLRRAERRPEVARRHNAKVNVIMAAGYALSFAVIVGMGWLIHGEMTPPPRVQPAREAGLEAHWRRVMRLLPGNSTAPLELAYRLARKAGTRNEAAELAARARSLACAAEDKAAADRLTADLVSGTLELLGESSQGSL